MSQWARENPERIGEIARRPMNEQNDALREAIGYDPDAIREREEERLHHHRDLSQRSGPPQAYASPPSPEQPAGEAPPSQGTPAGTYSIYSRRPIGNECSNCGAGEDQSCQPWCIGEQYS